MLASRIRQWSSSSLPNAAIRSLISKSKKAVGLDPTAIRSPGWTVLLLVFHVHILSVDYAFVFLLLWYGFACPRNWARRGLRRICFVKHPGQFVAGVGEFLVLRLQLG